MSEKKPLVLDEGRIQQLQPADQIPVEARVEQLERLFRQLLISCAMNGVEFIDEELQAEFAHAMSER